MLDAEQRDACVDLPCVLARTRDGYVMLLGREPLEAMRGDASALRHAIVERVNALASLG